MLKSHASAREGYPAGWVPYAATLAKESANTAFLKIPIENRNSPRHRVSVRRPFSPPKWPNWCRSRFVLPMGPDMTYGKNVTKLLKDAKIDNIYY
jgi:hypothetical protein